MKNYHPMIEKEAYYLWEKAGKPSGMDKFFWYLAKEKIKLQKKLEEAKEEADYEKRKGLLSRLGVFG